MRVGEHHADHAAAQAVPHIGVAAGVFTGNFALVGGFVQQGQLVGGVACNEDVRDAGLHGARVGYGHAACVFLDIEVFQPDVVHIGAAADGGEQVVGGEYAAFAVLRPYHFHLAFIVEPGFGLGVEVEWNFLAEDGSGVFQHHGVGNTADEAAQAEHFHAHTEAAQGLAELEADYAGAEYGHAFG